MAFLNTHVGGNIPDVQFLFVAAPMRARPYLAPVVQPYADGFACRAVVLRPESRGHLELTSADPLTPPRIIGNYLSTGHDRAVLRQGLRMARDVGHQSLLKPFIAAEMSPGPDNWSDGGLDAHIAATGITVHHPLGTCRMGPADDGMTVVDGALHVHGVENLRVVDASVMPDMVGGNINAAVIMIAEKASDLIRGKPVLAPAADG
jgi:4-pyridoxate dehydrogenase